MKESYVNLINIRRQVFAEIARIAYNDEDLEVIESASFRLIPGEIASYRDSVFRERAVLDERLRFTLGLGARDQREYQKVSDGIAAAESDKRIESDVLVEVIPYACEACPEKQHLVTDNCRKCLAHPCANVCPVNAISIGKDRAEINHEKCINCGMCKRTCPYSAIVETGRPCAMACGVNAVESDYLGRAYINQNKCVACGSCIVQCPYGAIADKSQIYQLIKAIKSGRKVYAIVAPSFVGQLGVLVSPEQIVKGIKMLGFEDVVEVSLGADYTTLHEAQEFIEKVPESRDFLATSCCFSWQLMVEKMFPEMRDKVSSSSSPMVYAAEHVKKDKEGLVCFIGPCISKKLEAAQEHIKDIVNFVITFEELAGMFIAKDIDVAELEVETDLQDASTLGRNYAIAGGVATAVGEVIKKLDPEKEFSVIKADGLSECVKEMKIARAGKRKSCLIEGMACTGGCIAGPGTISSMTKVRKALKEFADSAEAKTPMENKLIKE